MRARREGAFRVEKLASKPAVFLVVIAGPERASRVSCSGCWKHRRNLCRRSGDAYTPPSSEDTALDHPEYDKPSVTHRVEMANFRDDVAGHLRQARQGASFLITWDNEVVAELHPPPEAHAKPEPIAAAPEPTPAAPRRLVGSMRGKIWMAEDWDTWPEGFIEEMAEGSISPPEHKGE